MNDCNSRKCGLRLESSNDDEEYGLISTLGPLINSMESYFNVESVKDRDAEFTKEKYLQELQSQLSTSSGYCSLESLPSAYKAIRNRQLISSQSLGVIILLEDTLRNRTVVEELKSGPWSFHHTMQLLDWENNCVIAKQDFYELSSELPLVSASLTMSKKNIIRLNLFVKNKQRMQQFYEDILQMYPSFEAKDYCCFVLKSTEAYEIQFSLKLSRHLDINSTKHAQLIFQVPRISRLSCRPSHRKSVVQTCDPEGNLLILVNSPNMRRTTTTDSSNGCAIGRQRNDAMHTNSKIRLGDGSAIRTRKKSSASSCSTSTSSDSSSTDTVNCHNGIIFSGCPITL
eukprot:gene18228-20046_t